MNLYPHQSKAASDALQIIHSNNIVYLVMEVRTGKTITALSIAENFFTKPKNTVAFITKLKAIPSIQSDFDKNDFSFKLIVTNYEAVHKIDQPENIDLWILDEAHCLGQYPKMSIRTANLKKIINGKPTILLSGTPTPESYSQIYHQLLVTGNSPFQESNFYKWAKSGYVNVKQKMIGSHLVNDYSKANIDLINDKIKHLIVSCSQQDAGFENKVIESFIPIHMNDISHFLFKSINDLQVIDYGGKTFVADTPANLINKLSQIAGGTLIDDQGDPLIFDDAKIQYIKNNYAGKKIAIYYRYKAEFTLLSNNFPKHTTDWNQFENEDIPVFLSQIQSGREGISLRSADLIVMYNIDFSATSYWQVRARQQYRDRVGDCHIHWLFSDLDIEKKVYKAVSQKKNFTSSYYIANYGRIKNSKKSNRLSQKKWLDSNQDQVLFPTGVARPASTQGRTDDFYRMQSPRKASDGTAKVPTQCTPCDWL